MTILDYALVALFGLAAVWIIGMWLIHRKRGNPDDRQGKPYIPDNHPPSSGVWMRKLVDFQRFFRCAWLVDQNRLDTATASKAKLFASEVAVRVSEQVIRIHGGAGIMREYPVGRIHRDALVYVIGEGTTEVQRNIIARSLHIK